MLAVLVPDVPSVVVLVMVTVIQLLSVDVELNELLVTLVEIELIETMLEARLFEVDEELSFVEVRRVDALVLE
jgi:hypothetical protein